MFFKEFYNTILQSPFGLYEEVPFPVKKMSFRKGDVITQYGQVEDTFYFINNGIVEMTIKSYMSEKIMDFFFEKELFCAYVSFITRLPSDVQTMAIVDSEIEVIKREDLIKAYDVSIEANKFGRISTEHGYVRRSNREKELLTKTAEERYAEMFQTHTQYISHIPVNKIAKYLGIHPESLSRIRKKVNF